MKIFLYFFAVNIAVVLVVVMLFVAPGFESLRNGQAVVFSQESRYFTEQRLLADFDANLRELDELNEARAVFPLNEIAGALANVGQMAAANGLHQINFVVAEPVGNDVGGWNDLLGSPGLGDDVSRVFSINVNASYSGMAENLLRFVYMLDKSFGVIHDFAVEMLDFETAQMNVEFSLFGSEYAK